MAWAVAAFKLWIQERNKASPDDVCPEDFLELDHSGDVSFLERWICRLVVEARKQDGHP